MNLIINKRNKQSTFNYEESENFILKDTGRYSDINSYYFTAHDEEKSIYIRYAKRGNGQIEVWLLFKIDNKTYHIKKHLFLENECPLSLNKVDGKWTISFKGTLLNESNVDTKVSFSLTFKEKTKAIDFGSDMPSKRIATCLAQEKWNKKLFTALEDLHQIHYEQVGSLEGNIVIENKTIQINLHCIRDHSYGTRVWKDMNNHVWLTAISKDLQLNYSLVSYPSLTSLEVGNYIDKDNEPSFLLKAHYDRSIIIKEIEKESILELKFTNKVDVDLKVVLESYEEIIIEEGDYIVYEGLATFFINGKKARGIYEVGLNRNKERLFNGRKTKNIKE